jgi:hypothetical protein
MRKFIIPAFAGFLLLGGCTAAQIEAAQNTIEGDIQAGTSLACGIIPTLETITSVAGVLFPGIGSITAIGAAGETALENAICKAAPPAASARYRALPLKSGAPALIGSVQGVPVSGWRSR